MLLFRYFLIKKDDKVTMQLENFKNKNIMQFFYVYKKIGVAIRYFVSNRMKKLKNNFSCLFFRFVIQTCFMSVNQVRIKFDVLIMGIYGK